MFNYVHLRWSRLSVFFSLVCTTMHLGTIVTYDLLIGISRNKLFRQLHWPSVGKFYSGCYSTIFAYRDPVADAIDSGSYVYTFKYVQTMSHSFVEFAI
ncbi:unnamed protein product, partial [Dicrocoelium dendriticum]